MEALEVEVGADPALGRGGRPPTAPGNVPHMDALLRRISSESGLILIVAVAMVALALPVVIWRIRSGSGLPSAAWRTGLEAAILGSLAGIVALTLGAFATGGQGQVNLVPFRSLLDAFSLGEFWIGIVLVDLAANFILYVPLGLFVALRFPNLPIWSWAVMACTLSASNEIVQGVILNRSADITDVITNGLGGIVGFVVVRVAQRLARGRGDGALI